jgi:hypothetical protein
MLLFLSGGLLVVKHVNSGCEVIVRLYLGYRQAVSVPALG